MLFNENPFKEDNRPLLEQLISDNEKSTPLTEEEEFIESCFPKTNHLKILTESLAFKKTGELKRCEAILDEVVHNFQDLKFTDHTKNYKKIEEVSDILGSYFGFAGLVITVPTVKAEAIVGGGSLSVLPDYDSLKEISTTTDPNVDPRTFIKQFSDKGEVIETTSDRIRFKPNYKPYGFIELSPKMFLKEGITGSEILAIIIHEIGHNMYHGSLLARVTGLLTWIYTFLAGIVYLVNVFLEKAVMTAAAKSKVVEIVVDFIMSIFYILADVHALVFNLNMSKRLQQVFGVDSENTLARSTILKKVAVAVKFIGTFAPFILPLYFLHLIGGTIGFILSVAFFVRLVRWIKMDGLSEETFCDNFAATHGYGPDLSSALTKLGNGYLLDEAKQQEIEYNSAYFFMSEMTQSFYRLVNLVELDPHPDARVRPTLMVHHLKKQHARAKNPEQKKFIEKQIVSIIKNSPKYNNRTLSREQRMRYLQSELKQLKLPNKDKISDDVYGSESVHALLQKISSMGSGSELDSYNDFKK